MTERKYIPCLGGPLDGKRLPSVAIRHVGEETYLRNTFCRWFALDDGPEVIQKAHVFVWKPMQTFDLKLPPDRHSECDWQPTEEQIVREWEKVKEGTK